MSDTVAEFTYAHSFRSQCSANCEMQRIKTRQTSEHKMEGCVLKKVPVQARLRVEMYFQGILGLGQPCRSLESNGSRPWTSITATKIHSRWNTHLKTLNRQTTKYSGRQTPKRKKKIYYSTYPLQQSTQKTFATLRRFLPTTKQTTLKQTLASHPLIQIHSGIIHLEEGSDLTGWGPWLPWNFRT